MNDRDVLRIVTLNLEDDGVDGENDERWQAAHELLARLDPDVLLRQEIRNQERHEAAARRLGMVGQMTPTSYLRHHTGILLRDDTFAVHEWSERSKRWRIPTTIARVSLRDAPEHPLHLISWHTSYDSVLNRHLEADDMISFARKVEGAGINLIAGGDCNSYPEPSNHEVVSLPDWTAEAMIDDIHRWTRATQQQDGTWVSDTYLDRLMTATGMTDTARHAADALGQVNATHPTAGHAPGAAGQDGPGRIDRIYVDPWLATAVTSVDVIDTSGISDHHAVMISLDLDGVVDALRRNDH